MKATTLKKATLAVASLSFLAGSAFSQTAVSGAGGYTTYDIQPGFNLIGQTLHNPIEVSATVTAVSGNTTTGDADLSGLTVGATYIMEITGGTLDGVIQEVTTWAGFDVTTPDDLQAAGLLAGDTFQMRKAATIAEVFGTGDDVVINKGTSTTGDLILVSDGAGGFAQYHHTEDTLFGSGDWVEVGVGAGAGDTAIVYTDGMYVQNRGGSAYDIVLTGMVKTENTEIGVLEAFNYLSAIYPVGSTLGTSGLADFVLKGTSTTGDLILMPLSGGGFASFHHTEDTLFGAGSWTQVGGASNVENTPLTSGFIIQRRAAAPYNADYTPPAFYSTL